MRKFLRILILQLGMENNKLIILTFTLLLLGSTLAVGQDISENNLTNTSISLKKEVQFYPNPAVEFLIVEISDLDTESTTFEVRSIIGNEMKISPEKIGSGKFKIKVKDFAPGYYFLVVKDDDTRFNDVYKFLKS